MQLWSLHRPFSELTPTQSRPLDALAGCPREWSQLAYVKFNPTSGPDWKANVRLLVRLPSIATIDGAITSEFSNVAMNACSPGPITVARCPYLCL